MWIAFLRARGLTPILFLLFAFPVAGQLRADFSMNTSVGCSPLIVNFSDRSSGISSGASYQWDFGNGNSSTLSNPTAIYTDVNTYTVTLTVKDGAQTSTASHQVTVYQQPSVDFSVSSTKICANTPVTFTSLSTPGSGNVQNYYWDFGDGSTLQGYASSQAYTYTVAQLATVSLTVTNSYGCTASAQKKNLVNILPALTASFSSDKRVLCLATDAVQFTNASSGPGTLSYVWDFGDGNSSTQINPSYSFNKKGIYAVKLTVNSSEGCSSTYQQSNSLNVASYNSDFIVPSLICQGSTPIFMETGTPTPDNTVWSADGVASYYSGDFYYYAAASGTHTIQMTTTFGTCTQTVTKTAVVNTVPVIPPFDAILSGKCGSPVTVNFADHTPGAVAWAWQFNYQYYNSVIGATTQTASTTYSSDNTYSIFLQVTNAAGCISTAIQQLAIYRPVVTINTTGTDYLSTCGQPITQTFSANSVAGIASYTWNFGDGISSTAPNPTHTWTNPGSYNIALSYTDKNGCTGVSNTITVSIAPHIQLDFSSASTTVCGNTPFVVTTNPNDPSVTWWYWDFGDGTYGGPGSSSAQHIYSAAGTYTVTLHATNSGCDTTVTKTNYVTVLPIFSTLTGFSNSCDNTRGDVVFNNSSTGAASLVWDFGDGVTSTVAGNLSQITHTYTKNGSYTVALTAIKDQCALKNYTTVNIFLKHAPPVLTADKKVLCTNDPLNVTVTDLLNPQAPPNNPSFYPRFEYGDGTLFYGYITTPYYTWTNVYSGTLSTFQKGETSIRAITTSAYWNCQDTSNYIPVQLNGANASYTIVAQNNCYQTPVLLKDNSQADPGDVIKSWSWNFGDGQTSVQNVAGATVSHIYANPGSYLATLTVTDAGGCTTSSSASTAYVTTNGPKASFYPSGTNVPLNSTIYFYNYTNSYGVNNPSYHWDFGDGNQSSSNSPSETYPVPGTYTVTLVATDPVSGCSSSYSQTIVVNNFNYAFQMNSSFITSNSCPPVLVRFTNTSYNYIRVSWDFGDGVTADNVNYPSHVYDQPGKYIVTLSVFGPNGLTGQYFDSVFVRSPDASLQAKLPEICIGQSDELDAHSTAHTILYTWDFGDGGVTGNHDSSVTHSYQAPGTYLSKLIVTDTSGCAAAANSSASVKVRALPVIQISPAQPVACLNSSVNLIATGGSVYSWSPGTGLSDPGSASPIASPVSTTTYRLTIYDDIGCTNTASTTVTVVQPETVTLTPDTSVCEGYSIRLQASGATNYAWIENLSGLSDLHSATPVVQPAVSGTYTVTGSDAYSCFTDTATVDIQVLPVPSVNAGPDIDVMAGTQVQLDAVGSSDVITYNWTPATYLSCADCAEPTCNAISQTQYIVKVWNDVGCYASDTILVKMECEEAKVAIPNAFTPNGDGHNDVFAIKGISVIRHLVIFDRNGEKVFERSNFIAADRSSCWDGSFNGHAAPTGTYVYYVEMQCPLGGSFSRRGTVVLVR